MQCVKQVLVLAVVLMVAGCAPSADSQTVVGPEATDLLPRLTGHLVWTGSRGEILAMSLPDKTTTVVWKAADDDADYYPVIHAVSGPDDKGRVAYIEDYFFV